MTILAIDAATEILSVAIQVHRESEQRITLCASRDMGLRHSRVLMPLVDQLLREASLVPADLDLIACTRGPGSFTGLRIGMSTAKGLAAAVASLKDLASPPIVSVPTLEVMAAAVATPGDSVVVPVIDGRKNRFYSAVFRGGARLTPDLDISAVDTLAAVHAVAGNSPVIVTGPHATKFAGKLPEAHGLLVDPEHRRAYATRLIDLAILAYHRDGADPCGLGPTYVRDSDAQISRNT